MINIKYCTNCLEVSGHANYDKKGQDIVCAGVSAIVLGALKWFNKKEIKISYNKNFIKIELIKKTKTNQMYIDLIVKQLKPIANEYKKYIKIVKE